MLRARNVYIVIGFIIVVNVIMSLVHILTSNDHKAAEFLTSVSLGNIEEAKRNIDLAAKAEIDEALVIALNNREIDIAKLLLKHGATIYDEEIYKQNAVDALLFSNTPETVRGVLGMLDVNQFSMQISSFIVKSIESMIDLEWDSTSTDSTRRRNAEIKKPNVERRFEVSLYLIKEISDTGGLVKIFNSLCRKRAGDIYHQYGYHVMRQILDIVNEYSPEMATNCILYGGRLAANIVNEIVENEDDINRPLKMHLYWGSKGGSRYLNRNNDIKSTLLQTALSSKIKSFTYHLVMMHDNSEQHIDDIGNYVNLNRKNIASVDVHGRTQLMLTMMMDLGVAEIDDARTRYMNKRVDKLKRLGVNPNAIDDQGQTFIDYIDIQTLDGLSKFNIVGRYFPEQVDAYIVKQFAKEKLDDSRHNELIQMAVIADRKKVFKDLYERLIYQKPKKKYPPSRRTVTVAERYNSNAYNQLYNFAEQKWKEVWGDRYKDYKDVYQNYGERRQILSQY